jgi:hypothetical protein
MLGRDVPGWLLLTPASTPVVAAIGVDFGDWPTATPVMISTQMSPKIDHKVTFTAAFGVGCSRSPSPKRTHSDARGWPPGGPGGGLG